MVSDTGALQISIETIRERHVSDLALLENMLFHGEDDLRKILANPSLQCLVATGCCPRPWVPDPRSVTDHRWRSPSKLVDHERRVLGALFSHTVWQNVGVVKKGEFWKDFCNINEIPVDIHAPFEPVAGILIATLKKHARRERWSHLEVNIGERRMELVPFFEKQGFTHAPTNDDRVRRLVWSLLSKA